MTRRTRTFIVTTLTFGAVLAGMSPALAMTAPQSQPASTTVAGKGECSPNPPEGEGWHTPGQVGYGSCDECLFEAYWYGQAGAQTHCQGLVPDGDHTLWIRWV